MSDQFKGALLQLCPRCARTLGHAETVDASDGLIHKVCADSAAASRVPYIPRLSGATLRELAGEIVRYEPLVFSPKPATVALFSSARAYLASIGEPPEDRTDTSGDGT